MYPLRRFVIAITASVAIALQAGAATPDLVINEVMSNPDPDRANPFGFDDGSSSDAKWCDAHNSGTRTDDTGRDDVASGPQDGRIHNGDLRQVALG